MEKLKKIVNINGELNKHLKEQRWKAVRLLLKKESRSFLRSGLKRVVSWNIRSFLRVAIFIFQALKVIFWKVRTAFFWEKYNNFFRVFFSWRVSYFLRVHYLLCFDLGLKSPRFHFQKYKKSILSRKEKKFFSERVFLGKIYKNFFRKRFWGLR